MSEKKTRGGDGIFRVSVLGGGTFATALAMVFARGGAVVKMYMRRKETVDSINNQHVNSKYFPDIPLLESITATNDPNVGLVDFPCDLILHAVPVQPSIKYLKENAKYIPEDVPIVSLSKGIHVETLGFMIDIIRENVRPNQPVALISGPSFARELLEKQPTGLIVASEDAALAESIQTRIASMYIRCYTTTDVLGVELGGALKNIYAIASGIASGMGFKYNTSALIVTRGCSEIKRLSLAMGGESDTLNGLSGIGDMMLTCFGPSSRNRSLGFRLGQGEKLKDIIESMMEVAEGVPTALACVKLAAKYNVDMPLAGAVAKVLNTNDEDNPQKMFRSLMQLPAGAEQDPVSM